MRRGHLWARRRLAELVDGSLPEAVRLDVDVHVASCARCRRVVRELEWSEQLLMGVPLAILPLEPDAATYARLARLARWKEALAPRAPRERWPVPMFSLASAAALVMIAVMSGRLGPADPGLGMFGTPYMGSFHVVSMPTDASLIPRSYR